MKKILFTIGEEQLERGLSGIPVGYSPLFYVEPGKEIFYRGVPLEEVLTHSVEEVLYLLLFGNGFGKGSRPLEEFTTLLKKKRRCSRAVLRSLFHLPRHTEPTRLLAHALFLLSSFEGKRDYLSDALTLIAKLPHLVASLINYHAGWGETPEPRENLGYIENFTHMLQIPYVDKEVLVKIFHQFSILHYDHGKESLPTHIASGIASSGDDLYGAMGGALCAFCGKGYGTLPQKGIEEVRWILEALKEPSRGIDGALCDLWKYRGEMSGFYAMKECSGEEQRAEHLYSYGKKKFREHPFITTASKMRERAFELYGVSPSSHAISGSLFAAGGFVQEEYYSVILAMARIVGMAIQVVHERCEDKGSKGVRSFTPKYLYRPMERSPFDALL